MQKRTRTLLPLCGLAIAGVALLVMMVGNSASNTGIGEASLLDERIADTAEGQGSQESARGSSVSAAPFPGIKKDRIGTLLEDDMFGPTSKAEQDWLHRNGFPTHDQIQAYSLASSGALRDAARAGDVVAEAFYESHRLMEGDPEAETRLRDLAARGYTFGLARMAAYFSGSRADRDVVKAYAYSRATEMLGDTKRGLTSSLMFPDPLNPLEKMEAEAFAIELYGAILERRRQLQGPNAAASDPRPVHVD